MEVVTLIRRLANQLSLLCAQRFILGLVESLMWAVSPYFLCKPPSLEFCIFLPVSLFLCTSTDLPVIFAGDICRSLCGERGERQCLVYWTPWKAQRRFGSAEQLRSQHPAVFLYLLYPQNTTQAFSISSIILNCTRRVIRDSYPNN